MDNDIIITYETLYELLRKEKSRAEIQKLEDNFYSQVIKYMNEKNSILESQARNDSIFSANELEKTKKQILNIKKIIKELHEKRENKIIQLAIVTSRTNAEIHDLSYLLPEEKSLYEELVKILKLSSINIIENLIAGKHPQSIVSMDSVKPKDINMDSEGSDNKLLRILTPLPKFMGTNLEVYGPFLQESVVNLPAEIASLLIKSKKAEEIKA